MTFRTAVDRLFDETVVQPGASFSGTAARAVDLYQTAEEVLFETPLPGVDTKDIHFSVTGDVLTLRGEIREERDVEGAQYLVKERRFGGFTRSIRLPTAVVADKADAQLEHGVLTLKLPNGEEVKPKTITLRARQRTDDSSRSGVPAQAQACADPFRRASLWARHVWIRMHSSLRSTHGTSTHPARR